MHTFSRRTALAALLAAPLAARAQPPLERITVAGWSKPITEVTPLLVDEDKGFYRAQGVDLVVCTLKDAVKLWHRWPRQAPPLWYLSQSVVMERGEREFAHLLGRLLERS